MRKNKKAFCCYMDKDLFDQLSLVCKKTGVTKTAFVIAAIKTYMEKKK